jgi:Histidine kinase-, DNA gyrase B-, and HSP90-like ATPase
MTQLQRTTFETSRAAEYFDARQLSALVGVSQDEFASVCLKELVDNSLDACETAGVVPVVGVKVEREDDLIRLSVSDNGPGIPAEVVRKVLDYNVRVSDKAAYRSPTRGAQGNALKTVIGIPYALGSREPLVVEAQGVSHRIRPWVDPAGAVHFDYTWAEMLLEAGGTTVSLQIPDGWEQDEFQGTGDYEYHEMDFDPLHWVRSFAAFNPHATVSYQAKCEGSKRARFYKTPSGGVSYQAKDTPSEVAEIYKRTVEGRMKKYVPTQPTSPHWYSEESLKGLVFNHIAHSRAGGRDLPIGEFVRQFQGLSSTRKAKAVAEALPEHLTHLSSFADEPEMVGILLELMQRESKPPKVTALGWGGKEHFETFFENTYEEIKEYTYTRKSGTLPSGLPFTFEFALGILGEGERGHLYCGINFSPTFGDPLAGTTLVGPKFKASGIQGFLSEGHALPKRERAWYETPTSVAVCAHIVTPAPLFLDRGKTRLNMEGA